MAAPATSFNLSKPDRTIQAGVILMQSETEILDVAPIDLLHVVSKEFIARFSDELVSPEMKAQGLDIEFHWVNQTKKPGMLTGALQIQPTDDFSSCPPLDIVIMGAQRLDYVPTEAELAYIRKSFEDCSAFITICAGFQSGLQAGIFQGKTAAAPRLMLDQLREMAPTTNWVEKRWQRDGKLWTSGALLNGLDLMRAFATEYWGGEGSLIEFAIEFGHYPKRDVDYADAPTKL